MFDQHIFVTGGTGFIGSYILRTLIKLGYKNISCLRKPGSVMNLVEPITTQINWIDGTLSDTEILYDHLQSADRIIHAAAIISFHSKDWKLMYKTNVEGTSNLVNAALAANRIKKFVFISSIAALGRRQNNQTITENSNWEENRLNTPYAITKYLAELEIWRGSEEGLPIVILNPSIVLGSGFWEEGSIRIIKNIFDGLKYFPRGTTGFVDVRDVAKAAEILLRNDIIKERFIISCVNKSFQEIFQQIAYHLHKNPPETAVSPFMEKVIPWISYFATLFGEKDKIITRESLRSTNNNFIYLNEKSIQRLDFTYRPIETTIAETCAQFLESVTEHFKPAFLPI